MKSHRSAGAPVPPFSAGIPGNPIIPGNPVFPNGSLRLDFAAMSDPPFTIDISVRDSNANFATFSAAPVPEPGSLALWGFGMTLLGGWIALRRRRIHLFDWLKPCHRGFLSSVLGVSLALAALGDAGTAHAGLVITPTFDASITSNPDATAVETAINASIGIYESLFTDPVNVGILFRYATTFDDGTPLTPGILGNNFHTVWSFSYNTYINALNADGTTANDATALGNLPAASAFPNSPRNLQFSSANGRAVGLNTPPLSTVNGVPGVFDGVVTLNSGQPFQFDRTGGIAPTNVDAMRVIEHEIDEVLGLGSTLPDGVDFAGAPAVSPEDLFRYSAPGTIGFTNSASASSYFSIDGGVTSIVGFNQDPDGDYGDWVGSPTVALVQAAFIGHHQADISGTSPEGIALDVIGYDLVPEPSTLTLWSAGTLLLAGCAWRRRWNSRSHGPPV